MNDNNLKNICIVGAGLSGTMCAAMLGKLGYKVSVFEKRVLDDEKKEENGHSMFGNLTSASKRSINLAMSFRGMCALSEIGGLELVMANAIRMSGRYIHNISGGVVYQPYGGKNDSLWSVGRQTLNAQVLQVITSEKSNVNIFYGYTLLQADITGKCTFINSSGIKSDYVFDFIIGADGAFSQIRENMLRQGRINYSRTFISHGYKELTIPPIIDSSGNHSYALLNHEGLHIWPRGKFMLIALPNPDKSFTATLFAPMTGVDGFDTIDSTNTNEINSYFHRHFPDVISIMPTLVSDFQNNPVGSLLTLKTSPWVIDKMMVIGDAAHAVVPFYGQGMNAAFEDALLLYRSVIEHQGDLQKAALAFQTNRIPATDALADLCVEHYEDMAHNTSSALYIIQKKLEILLQSLFPSVFKSLYSMVSFSDIPYHIAVKRSEKQNLFISRFLYTQLLVISTITTFTLRHYLLSWNKTK